MSDGDVAVLLVTAPDEKTAAELAARLVDDRLAACVNLIPSVRSIYRWEGKTCDDQEWLLVIKTRASAVADLARVITEAHPYDVPEVVALPVVGGSDAYLSWVKAQVGGEE